MAYLVRIGRIDTNKSGVGARGYQILRQGKTVILRWGRVDVIDGSIYWGGSVGCCYGGYEEQKVRRSSEVAARAFARSKKRFLCKPNTNAGSYQCLPTRARIYKLRPIIKWRRPMS